MTRLTQVDYSSPYIDLDPSSPISPTGRKVDALLDHVDPMNKSLVVNVNGKSNAERVEGQKMRKID